MAEFTETSGGIPVYEPSDTGIYLYWLPLGAGGSFVRFNGRVFEFVQARIESGRFPLLQTEGRPDGTPASLWRPDTKTGPEK
jgi:hypothetical protein